MELYSLSATQLLELLHQRKVSPVEIKQSIMARVRTLEPQQNAFLHIIQNDAASAEYTFYPETTCIAGIPVGLSDNICTRNIPSTCASKILENFTPYYSAVVVEQLMQAGAWIAGKTNIEEWGIGATGINSYFKTTRNPWNNHYTAGGACGGSAAAVAAGQVPLALGFGTNSAISLPASFCGVLSLRPTYEAISRAGLIAHAPTINQLGIFARTVADAALLFSVVSKTSEILHSTVNLLHTASCIQKDLTGLVIGCPREYFDGSLSPCVQSAITKALAVFQSMGACCIELSLPSLKHSFAAHHIISCVETCSSLARMNGVGFGLSAKGSTIEDIYVNSRSEGFGMNVQNHILLGTFFSSECNYKKYVAAAHILRQEIQQEYAQAFSKCDMILNPVTNGRCMPVLSGPMSTGISDYEEYTGFSAGADLAGLPVITLPCGAHKNAIPFGMQLTGPKWSEPLLLKTAQSYETAQNGFPMPEVAYA